jgi:chromosome segregation ATPase
VITFAEQIKRQFLELLERDIEFRYAVAGYLGLSEILKRLEEHDKKFEEILKEIRALRENQNKLWEEIRSINIRLGRVERTLEKITLDIEEEARIVIKHKLKEIGYDIDVSSLILPEIEINIYGTSNDLCIIGEARIRASSSVIDEINNKIEILKKSYPNMLRPRILKIVYTSFALPDLITRAEKENIWVLKAIGDVVKPKL